MKKNKLLKNLKNLEILNKLQTKCLEENVELKGCDSASGHYKIIGDRIVNYYPFSKNRTAYIRGEKSKRGVSIEVAVSLSITKERTSIKANNSILSECSTTELIRELLRRESLK